MNEAHFKDNITFAWEQTEHQSIHLIIFNNRGDDIFNTVVEDAVFKYSDPLDPGLYYWKLENEDELLYLGKFFVDKE